MPTRWDIFCKVVDNFGDIGVCWRLAKQLQAEHGLQSEQGLQLEHGLQVRLWVDDWAVAQLLIPALTNSTRVNGVSIMHWHNAADFSQAADVVIEAFACGLPEPYLTGMQAKKSKWINLEYLSAEAWVDDFHGKPSPQANGLTRHFYFPGFTEKTGGLMRESDIAQLLENANNPRPQTGEGARQRGRGAIPDILSPPLSNLSDGTTKQLTKLTNDISQVIANPANGREAFVDNTLNISLFCYPNAPIKDLLNALRANNYAACIYVPQSSILPKIAEFFGEDSVIVGDKLTKDNLTVHILPFLSQAEYDQLLHTCDLNFVRGEDSWIRAIWAGKPFIWQPYWQTENTHLTKLNAFLDLFYADFNQKEMLCKAHGYWAAGQGFADVFETYLTHLPIIEAHTQVQKQLLLKQVDLASQIVAFAKHI